MPEISPSRYMLIPIGFSERRVSEDDLRSAQRAVLCGDLSEDHVRILDACVSLICCRIARQS